MIKILRKTFCCWLAAMLLALTGMISLALLPTPAHAAQNTPHAGTSVITLTVTQGATVRFEIQSDDVMPVWVENGAGVFTHASIGGPNELPGQFTFTASGTTLKVYGAFDNFSCVGNQGAITALDISKNTLLGLLACGDNALTSLDVSKNTALYNLDCSKNRLTTLDVQKNSNLGVLNCNENQLTSLDIRSNTALEALWCPYNKLTALDVSQNTALETLNCSDNALTALDVHTNTALRALDCKNNTLTSLILPQKAKLQDIDYNGNPLTKDGIQRR